MTNNSTEETTYLLWRLHTPDKYSAVAYLSSDFVLGRALPKYLILDKANFGPEGSENDDSSFYVHRLPEGKGESQHLGGVNTLMEGIRKTEAHWTSQQ